MTRPMILKLLPYRLKQTAYYSFYHTRHHAYTSLFKLADLAFAPNIAMHDLIVGDVISGNLAFLGFYELDLSKRLIQLAKLGGTFVDVGANMGYFTLLWTGSNSNNNAITFEASPRNISLLARNIELNGLLSQVTQFAKAAGRHNGTVAFDIGPAEQSGWGGITSSTTATAIQVPVVRLDDELEGTAIDVLKIDVEGADTWVLFGCERLLAKKMIRNIFFEQNPSRMAALGIGEYEAKDYLHAHGYECLPFGNSRDEWYAYPKIMPID